eukprot:TRINITY_DN1724_c0_g1_i8.p2 TRINITY_DN1724_c0_g1~~TRINITY_DN1724_c0_g1_i8.p2  ORF type:complete len:128 (-),score=39.11 TRINITY_DN1724_c0_g1_i8:50-433(-)
MAIDNHYCTGEPFLDGEYDLRIQKIGNCYRAYKRSGTGQWKTNTGTSVLEEIELTPQYKMWADAASQLFGGLDICAVDAIHGTDGKEYILEVNDTAIGLGPTHELEDMHLMKDLILQKLELPQPAAQ